MKALFIHRSVGQNFINEAGVRELLPNISFHDLNANTNAFTNEQGVVETPPITVQDGNTNPDGLALFFKSVSTNSDVNEVVSGYDLIAFKSCYSASALPTDAALQEVQAAYEGAIRDFITQHPTIRFLIISPPPRRLLLTSRDSAERAKAFATFLRTYSDGLENVIYFDLFGLLSDTDGYLKREYRRILPFDQHPNKKGSMNAGEAFATCVLQYSNPTSR